MTEADLRLDNLSQSPPNDLSYEIKENLEQFVAIVSKKHLDFKYSSTLYYYIATCNSMMIYGTWSS